MTPARPLKIGERVVITMVNSSIETGTVLWVSTEAGFTTVQLDGSKELLDYQLLDLRLNVASFGDFS